MFKIYIKIAVAALVTGIIVFLSFKLAVKPVRISIDRADYKIGDSLEVVIKNNFNRQICFSSCYPYLIERETEDHNWTAYPYSECGHDLVHKCIEPGAERKFRLAMDEVEPGQNRLKIPICVDCQGRVFSAEFAYYSNNFDIK